VAAIDCRDAGGDLIAKDGNEFVMLKSSSTQRITNPPIILAVNWHLRPGSRPEPQGR
jgi:hypothetical protein